MIIFLGASVHFYKKIIQQRINVLRFLMINFMMHNKTITHNFEKGSNKELYLFLFNKMSIVCCKIKLYTF